MHDVPEDDRAAQARRDAEYAAMVRRLQAEEQARCTGCTVEQVLGGWAAEDAERPTTEELCRRHDAAIAAAHDAVAAMRDVPDVAGAAAAAEAVEAAIERVRRAAGGAPGDDGILAERFRVASEMRGETIHYLELDADDAVARETSMEFYWTREYEIYVDRMRRWWHPATRAYADMTQAERRAVVARVVAWARRAQGVTLHVRDADW
jgi:hypothetical protein